MRKILGSILSNTEEKEENEGKIGRVKRGRGEGKGGGRAQITKAQRQSVPPPLLFLSSGKTNDVIIG